jgi:hypothetical protein
MGSPVVYCINTHDAPSSKSVWTACWPPTCASVGGSSFATTSAGRHCHHALHRVHLGHRRCFLHDLRYHLRDRRRYHRHAHRLQMAAETPITLSGRVQTSIRTSCERRRLALEVGACEAKHGFFYACAVKAMETLRIVTGWSKGLERETTHRHCRRAHRDRRCCLRDRRLCTPTTRHNQTVNESAPKPTIPPHVTPQIEETFCAAEAMPHGYAPQPAAEDAQRCPGRNADALNPSGRGGEGGAPPRPPPPSRPPPRPLSSPSELLASPSELSTHAHKFS